MIDRSARDNLAHRLRLLAAGQISNDEFEASVGIASADPAIWRIYSDGAWKLYGDLWEYKLIGRHKLTPEIKRNVARLILFLKSDREFEWQEPSLFTKGLMIILGLVSFGIIPRWYCATVWGKQGDKEVWPYIRKADFEADMKQQPYLKPLTRRFMGSA